MSTARCLAMIIALTLAGCHKPETVEPRALAPDTVCALDGMVLMDYPGPKAQIQYDGRETEFFCDTVEMFAMVLQPEQKRRIVAVYTQDMGTQDWSAPRGGWIDARSAFYVVGSDVRGSMGPTFASFARREDADAFASRHGGKVVRFDQVTPGMADLRGGAQRDQRM